MNAVDVIADYEKVLSTFGEVVDFDISALDRLGIPVTSCTLIAAGRFASLANGYGPTSDAARIGGLGELTEGVLMRHAVAELLRDGIRESRHAMVDAHGADRVVDPRTLGLPAGSSYDDDRPLTWLPATRVRTGETVFVPADLVVSEPGELPDPEPLIVPVTNGLGAGLDESRAVNHAILEILQRHTNGLRFRALDRRSPEVAADGLPASVRHLITAMEAEGVHPVVKHAATELGVCSTYVVGRDDEPADLIQLTACGEAAHPSAEISITKAVLEFANSRARKAFFFGRQPAVRQLGPPAYWAAVAAGAGEYGESRARAAMQHWAELGPDAQRELMAPNRDRSVAYADIRVDRVPDLSGQDAVQRYLLDALDHHLPDHDVLAVTTSIGAVSAAKVLITNLEVEILSYGRIGELGARMALDADLDLVRIANQPSATHPDRVALTAAAEERLGGPVYFSYQVANRIVGDLYLLYREPPRHSIMI